MLNSSDYQRKANQNYSEIPSLTSHNGSHQNIYEQQKLEWARGNWVLTVAGHVNWYSQYREHCAGSVRATSRDSTCCSNPTPRHLCPNPRCRRYRHPSVFSALFTVTDMEATYFSIDRIRGKEGLIHMPNGTVLSHRKEWNNATGSNRNGPGDSHSKWSQSHRQRRVSPEIANVQTLKKWYKWNYLQNKNRLTNLENKLRVITKGERWRAGTNWELETYNALWDWNR